MFDNLSFVVSAKSLDSRSWRANTANSHPSHHLYENCCKLQLALKLDLALVAVHQYDGELDRSE